jgi:hypothetical protein
MDLSKYFNNIKFIYYVPMMCTYVAVLFLYLKRNSLLFRVPIPFHIFILKLICRSLERRQPIHKMKKILRCLKLFNING